MNKQELILNVQKLADKWKLNDLKKQELKIFEEFGELCKAELENDIDEIKDGIGDVIITILIHSKIEYGRIHNKEELNEVSKNIDCFTHFGLHKSCEFEETAAYNYVLRVIYSIIQKHNIDPWECLETEYNKVSKRKGETKNGTFIKEKES